MATVVETKDMQLLISALKAFAGECLKDPDALASAVFRYLRRDIPPGEAMTQERLAFYANLLDVETEVLQEADAAFLAQFPRYNLQPGNPGYSTRRNKKPDVLTLARQEAAKTTIKIDTPLAKAGQRAISANVEFVRMGILAGNNRHRGRDFKLKNTDADTYLRQGYMESLKPPAKRPRTAFNGEKTRRPRADRG